MSDPQAEQVTNEEALKRLRELREVARRATDAASLTTTQRNRAYIIARTLSDEIERILVHEIDSKTGIYRDAAQTMHDLIQPLREAKKDIEKIIATVQEARKFVSIVDRALSMALQFAA